MIEADPQSGNLYDESVIWSTTSNVALRILQYREKKLKEDSIWIRGALTQLRENRTSMESYYGLRQLLVIPASY